MRTRRTRTITATPDALWAVVADPYHQPRWWPRVQRVEQVTDDAWTAVFGTAKGRAVRADYALLERREPDLLSWEQELEGTPFERVMTRSVYELRLEARDAGSTEAVLSWEQALRGFSRFGGFLVRRAARRTLDEALENLAAAAGAAP